MFKIRDLKELAILLNLVLLYLNSFLSNSIFFEEKLTFLENILIQVNY